MENITRKQPLPKIPNQRQLLNLTKQNILEHYIFVQEVPRMQFIMVGQSQILTNSYLNWDFKFELNQFLFLNQVEPFQKFKLKSWGASILL